MPEKYYFIFPYCPTHINLFNSIINQLHSAEHQRDMRMYKTQAQPGENASSSPLSHFHSLLYQRFSRVVVSLRFFSLHHVAGAIRTANKVPQNCLLVRCKRRVFILKLLSSYLPRVPSDAPEWPRGFPKASYVVTEENSGRKQESCCNPQTKCCQATPFYSLLWQQFWNQRVSQEDVRGDIKDIQSGLGVLDPIPICVCMWWYWFPTLPSNSQVQLGALQFN